MIRLCLNYSACCSPCCRTMINLMGSLGCHAPLIFPIVVDWRSAPTNGFLRLLQQQQFVEVRESTSGWSRKQNEADEGFYHHNCHIGRWKGPIFQISCSILCPVATSFFVCICEQILLVHWNIGLEHKFTAVKMRFRMDEANCILVFLDSGSIYITKQLNSMDANIRSRKLLAKTNATNANETHLPSYSFKPNNHKLFDYRDNFHRQIWGEKSVYPWENITP